MNNFQRKDVSDFDDIASKDQYKRALEEGLSEEEALYYVNRRSRDNSRTPFHWDSSSNGGFTGNDRTWIKMSGDHEKVNVELQQEDRNSVLSHYKKIIRLRQKSIYSECLIYGEFIPIEFENNKIIGYLRKDDSYELLCLNNFSDEEETVCLKILGNKKIKDVIVNNYEELNIENEKMILKGHQSVLIELEGVH